MLTAFCLNSHTKCCNKFYLDVALQAYQQQSNNMASKKTTLLILLIAVLAFQCRKHENESEIKKLPPATQTGAGTFGCLINGKAFIPRGGVYSGNALRCVYEISNGGIYVKLSATDSTVQYLEGVSINTNNIAIQEGQTITLEGFGKTGVGAAEYFTMGTDAMYHEYITTPEVTGELHITRFDEAAQIISGTFWFDAVFADGIYNREKIQVREARFDLHYTR